MTLRIGSLFSGYGGLDLGVQAVIGGDVVWHVEFDEAPSKILKHHWPDTPNYGDITAVDWSTVPSVDVLTGGFPCQDVSLAGARKGLTEGTRSGLWSHYAEAIRQLKPELVVIENVRGLLSATAGGSVEPDPWGVGDGATRPVINALGAVLGDLADLGYDAEWCGVRAADAGAPHGRYRVFIAAYPQHDGDVAGAFGGGVGAFSAQGGHERVASVAGIEPEGTSSDRTRPSTVAADPGGDGLGGDAQLDSSTQRSQLEASQREHTDRCVGAVAENTDGTVGSQRGLATSGQTESGRTRANTRRRSGTPTANTGGVGLEAERRPSGQTQEVTESTNNLGLLPRTPGSSGSRGNAAPADTGGERFGEHPRESSAEETRPTSSDLADGVGGSRTDTDWGPYRPAIERWERVLGRTAPPPTNPDGRDGSHRLAAQFVEFMMGLPVGHVTDPAIGLTRNQQLKALGNGVVPQQAALALAHLLQRNQL